MKSDSKSWKIILLSTRVSFFLIGIQLQKISRLGLAEWPYRAAKSPRFSNRGILFIVLYVPLQLVIAALGLFFVFEIFPFSALTFLWFHLV